MTHAYLAIVFGLSTACSVTHTPSDAADVDSTSYVTRNRIVPALEPDREVDARTEPDGLDPHGFDWLFDDVLLGPEDDADTDEGAIDEGLLEGFNSAAD